MRKNLSYLLALVLAAGMLTPASAVTTFAGDAESWYEAEELSPEDYFYEDDETEEPSIEEEETEVGDETESENAEAYEGNDIEDVNAPALPEEQAESDEAAEEDVWGEYAEDDQAAAVTSGSCGDHLTWTLDGEGVLTISGTGAMDNYEFVNDTATGTRGYNYPWGKEFNTVRIEEGVTTIGENAFCWNYELRLVTIPDSVTTIGDGAFAFCNLLDDVYYLSSDEEWKKIEIGKLNDNYLRRAIIHFTSHEHSWSEWQALSENANGRKRNCSVCHVVEKVLSTAGTCGENLTWTLDDEGVLTIRGTGEMDDFFKVYDYDLNMLVGNYPWGTEVKEVRIEEGVTSIGAQAFCNCIKLEKIIIPESVTNIGHFAFEGCSGLESITIPNGVAELGAMAFSKCSNLKTITIPGSVTLIGIEAFTVCDQLKDVYYALSADDWSEIEIRKGNEALEAAAKHFNEHYYHLWGEWVVTTQPTVLSKGERTRICSVCSETETEEIPQIEVEFKDVPADSPFKDAIAWAKNTGITSGLTPTTFGIDKGCTRGQIVTFLWRAAGSPKPTLTANPFTDVKKGSAFYNAILWAVENKITGGTTATTFSPDQTCTRGQAVTFIYRAEGSPSYSKKSSFTDVSANQFFYNAVNWAVEKGITAGTSAGKFSPDAECTRGQIVTFLYRNRDKK